MIANWWRHQKARYRARKALDEIAARKICGKAHELPFPLVVSLTSYPGRFPTLGHTLRSLLRQTVQPDRVILWLDENGYDKLPGEILALQSEGLQIRQSPDWKSYNKIIPTLLEYPDHAVVVADDDVYYWPDWLEGLVNAQRETGLPILCHRADKIRFRADGVVAPYDDWERPLRRAEHSPLVLATGVLGVLYAPGVFHEDVTKADIFQRLSPTADDLWLYWMYRLNGYSAAKIGPARRILEWPGSQQSSLRSVNMLGASGNDKAIAALISEYGFPATTR